MIKTISAIAILLTVFGLSFLVFNRGAHQNVSKQPLVLTSAVINQTLPRTQLTSIDGVRIDDADLRRGKVVMAFMMPDCVPCERENEFLKPIINSRKDVRFVYVIPFGNKDENLKLAHNKYALEPFFDVGNNLSRRLELRQVPLKLFVEDGIIKRTFIDSAITPEVQDDFKRWLASL
jgi:hypothetical protein